MIKQYCDICAAEQHLLPAAMDGAYSVTGPLLKIHGVQILATAAPGETYPLQGFALCGVCFGNLLATYIEELNRRRNP